MRKTDRTLRKGEDVVVCLPGASIEHVTERVENVLGHGQVGSILDFDRLQGAGLPKGRSVRTIFLLFTNVGSVLR